MSIKTLDVVIKRCLSVAPNVHFVWHGGEPTVAGVDFYRIAIDMCHKYAVDGQRVTHSIQTNGTLLDEDWIKLFQQENISVGVSLDGPENLTNLTRIDASGKGAFSSIMRGINLLQSVNQKFGIIAVINALTIKHPDDIFSFMYSRGLSFAANPCVSGPDAPSSIKELAVDPVEYADFLLRLMDLWLETEDHTFKVGPVDDLIKAVLGGRPSLCRFNGRCHRYPTIDSNGDVYPCDEFSESKYLLGNARCQEFSEIFHAQPFHDYYSGRDSVLTACGSCQWLNVCKGGCMRMWNGRKSITTPQEHVYCQARQHLFQSVQNKLVSIGYMEKSK
ncbi:hypothetical protein A2368_01960 [Candidatus Collierbacteria bacterium RIFOXYB1_FULL_49_13]|uniref:Uncharacterized protein n=1 Tax=Candidatus Collierbacteria bacterium RIFOXYB1_FULL_49_13 TaxID=1817728 RepID=A0A1F5FGB6_9BACT|nr:MAG: hypothetical protein A2368_01960 [Candidatus Collierbacteria bacterium RIFOXYB1_FULL_49_13]